MRNVLAGGLAACIGLAAWSAEAQLPAPAAMGPDALMNAVTSEVIAVLKQDIATNVAQLVETRIDVLVRSAVRRRGAETMTLDYDMESTETGWKVYDVKIAGVSLVITYRETFAAAVRAGGIDGLVKSLSDKNRENDSRR